MAPNATLTQQAYAKDERVLCFHHELLYEAKVLDSKFSDPSDKKSQMLYRVHYKGWKNTWDDWVNSDRVRKLTEENKELAQNLKKDADAQRRPAPQKSSNSKKKNAGSDLSSNRGSEERQSSAPAMGRGQKRGRDYEIEKVGSHKSPSQSSSPLSELSSSASNLSGQNFVPPPRPFPSRAGRSGRAGSKALRARGTSSESASDSLYAVPPTRRSYVTHKGGLRTTYPPRLSNPSIDYPDAKVVKRIHHPALVEAGHYNTAKWYFYKSQNPNLKLMIAGVPMEKTLHPFDNTGAEISLPTPPRERDGNTNGHTAQDSNNPTFQEENFLSRPQIRIPCPDNLKSLLVDDWENVTKNLLLVPLPSKTPVNLILDTYFDEEKGKRRLGSAEADLLEEVVAGTKEYFDRCLGRILLYRFEREQFFDVRSLWEGAAGGEWEGKGAGDVYGAEHLARLFVSMPELIAQTNMDQQAISRLREELAKLTQWLAKNASRYFTAEYESATQEYIEKARGV